VRDLARPLSVAGWYHDRSSLPFITGHNVASHCQTRDKITTTNQRLAENWWKETIEINRGKINRSRPICVPYSFHVIRNPQWWRHNTQECLDAQLGLLILCIIQWMWPTVGYLLFFASCALSVESINLFRATRPVKRSKGQSKMHRNLLATTDVVWDRRSWDKTGLRLEKSVFVLVLQVWCCVVKHGLVTLVVIMILKDT